MIEYLDKAMQVNGAPPLQERFDFSDIERFHLNVFFREELCNVIWLQAMDKHLCFAEVILLLLSQSGDIPSSCVALRPHPDHPTRCGQHWTRGD